MVLGLRTKNRKGTSVQVDYLIHIQEIKPWPPSQSLKSLRSVLLQWENGDRNSGSTNPVIPSLGSGVGDGKIEFNESFRLPVALSREFSLKSGDADTFQKNCVEFNLYEPRRDKTVKGQLLGTVIVDLAEYGVLKETQIISAPMNCKRSFRNTAQPILFLKIEPYDKHGSGSSSRGSVSKEASLDMDGRESVSALMNGEYAEEAEIASFTDDDVSSHSSLTISSSVFEATRDTPPQNEENALEAVMEDSTRRGNGIPNLPLESVHAKQEVKSVSATLEHLNGRSSRSSSIDLSSGAGSPENDHKRSSTSITGRSVTHSVQSSSSSITYEGTEEDVIHNNSTKSFNSEDLVQEVHGNIADDRSKTKDNAQQSIEENNTNDHETKVAYSDSDPRVSEKPGPLVSADTWYNEEDDGKLAGLMEEKYGEKHGEYLHTEQTENGKDHFIEDEPLNEFSQDDVRKLGVSAGDTTLSRNGLGVTGNILSSDRLRHVKSVRSPLELSRSNGSISNNQFMRQKEDITLENARSRARSFIQNERKDTITASRDVKNSFSDSKVQQLQRRIENLERELREAAALEVSLYSIVAEHGSSANKVHAPARRLSRLYLHAWKEWSPGRRASAARSAVSGLVLVAKACGNDVPRLTFWLSNSVVLRAIISLALRDSRLSVSSPRFETNGGRKGNGEGSSPLKWKDCSPGKKENWFGCTENLDDWEDPQTFTTALEKIEAWIFSRIIESVWWQTLTPHMHSATEKACEQKICPGLRNSYGRKPSLSDQEQVNFSLELWKKAFKDACERLCPLRGAGHECGCLPVLARMVMEQCVSRLDVAMFNAILRESADEIPTDPVSDPISDPKVLPIPAGKSSFGAGAQLKNAIGNWSRWLTDLFGIDDDYSHEDEDGLDDYDRQECETSSKSFHLLNALSDLMMLPKDMLLNRSIRKEVCPTFGAPLIKKILDNFSPDEFCPDPIPEAVFEALDAEDPFDDAEEESISNFPCNAAPVAYSPPSAALFMDIIGEFGKEPHLRRSGSSVLRKSYTSDDELDELDSPLVSITDCFHGVTTPTLEPKENVGQNVVRYQLLREVWRDGD